MFNRSFLLEVIDDENQQVENRQIWSVGISLSYDFCSYEDRSRDEISFSFLRVLSLDVGWATDV